MYCIVRIDTREVGPPPQVYCIFIVNSVCARTCVWHCFNMFLSSRVHAYLQITALDQKRNSAREAIRQLKKLQSSPNDTKRKLFVCC